MTEKEIQELEEQLSCPNGAKGIEVAKIMNVSNIGMTISTIEYLDIQDYNSVLELGHGNCDHLGTLLTKANSISYFGLEISETMYVEAQRINQEIKNGKQIEFNLYDGENIPFEDNSFDRIMTVNSLYFWSSPEELFKEIGRTLKPGGYCVVTFARKDYLKQLPFVRQKFKMYDVEDIQNFIDDSNMEIVHIEDKVELNESKTGKKDERKYFMVKMTKK